MTIREVNRLVVNIFIRFDLYFSNIVLIIRINMGFVNGKNRIFVDIAGKRLRYLEF